MTAAIDALACPSCGSNAVSTEWRNLDPKTGRPTQTPLMTILLSSLLEATAGPALGEPSVTNSPN
jgi:hypothetical protein